MILTMITNSEDIMFNNELQQKPDPIDPSNSAILLASCQLQVQTMQCSCSWQVKWLNLMGRAFQAVKKVLEFSLPPRNKKIYKQKYN